MNGRCVSRPPHCSIVLAIEPLLDDHLTPPAPMLPTVSRFATHHASRATKPLRAVDES
jgi:hypothetical protein